jgi:hypothetical protein
MQWLAVELHDGNHLCRTRNIRDPSGHLGRLSHLDVAIEKRLSRRLSLNIRHASDRLRYF